MDLILFTSSKQKKECAKIEGIVTTVAHRFRKQMHSSVLDLEEQKNRLTALQFKITEPPALVLDGEPIFTEKLPTEEQLIKFIEGKLKQYAKEKPDRIARSRYWSISGLPEQWGHER
jgi:hypothetical protein